MTLHERIILWKKFWLCGNYNLLFSFLNMWCNNLFVNDSLYDSEVHREFEFTSSIKNMKGERERENFASYMFVYCI